MKTTKTNHTVRHSAGMTTGLVAILSAGMMLWSCSGAIDTVSDPVNTVESTDETDHLAAGKPLQPYCCSIKDAVNGIKKVGSLGKDILKKLGKAGAWGVSKTVDGVEYISDGSQWLVASAWKLTQTVGSWGEHIVVEGVEYVSDGSQWLYGQAKDGFVAFIAKTKDAASFAYNYEINHAPADLFGYVWDSSARRAVWKGLTSGGGFDYSSVGKWIERGGEWVFEHPEYAVLLAVGAAVPAVFVSAPAVAGGISAGAFIYVGQKWFFSEYGVQFPFYKKNKGESCSAASDCTTYSCSSAGVCQEGSGVDSSDPFYGVDPFYNFDPGPGVEVNSAADLSGLASKITVGVTTCRDLGFDNSFTIYQRGNGKLSAYVGASCTCVSASVNYRDTWCNGCDCSAAAKLAASDNLFYEGCVEKCSSGDSIGGLTEDGKQCGVATVGFRYCRTDAGACGWQWCQGNGSGKWFTCDVASSVTEANCTAKGI